MTSELETHENKDETPDNTASLQRLIRVVRRLHRIASRMLLRTRRLLARGGLYAPRRRPVSVKYVSGALTAYEHGSIGRSMTAVHGIALLIPLGLWAFSVVTALG